MIVYTLCKFIGEFLTMRYLRFLACAISLLMAVLAYGDSHKVLGVSPWTSGQLLKAWMQPVLEHLEKETGYNYSLKSGASLNEYVVKVAEEDFDLIMIPMHMGLFLTEYFAFTPIVFVRSDINIVLVTHKDGPYQKISDLEGAEIGIADPISIAGFFTEDLLAQRGIKFQKRYFGHHWKLTDGLIKKKITVAPIVNNHFKQRDGKTSEQLKILHSFPLNLDGIILLPPRARLSEVKKIQAVLSAFKPSEHSMINVMEPISEKELIQWKAKMQKYIPKIKSRIQSLHPEFSKKVGWTH